MRQRSIQKHTFKELGEKHQRQARASFFNAGDGDGYLYEIGANDMVLCRCQDKSLGSIGKPQPLFMFRNGMTAEKGS